MTQRGQVIGIFIPTSVIRRLLKLKVHGIGIPLQSATILPSQEYRESSKRPGGQPGYQVRTETVCWLVVSVSAPLDYLHGHGSLISGLENALDSHEVGDKCCRRR